MADMLATSLRLHPQAGLVPDMAPDEWDAFLADVRERGIVVPLDVARDGTVLDGRHRLRGAAEAGLSHVPVRFVDTDDPLGYMVRAALVRRHLTATQRRDLAASLLRERPERSDRQVARDAGLDHKTVAVVRGGMASTGEIPQLTTRVGADGRARPVSPESTPLAATRPRPAPVTDYIEHMPDGPIRDQELEFRAVARWQDAVGATVRALLDHEARDVAPLFDPDAREYADVEIELLEGWIARTREAMAAASGIRVIGGAR